MHYDIQLKIADLPLEPADGITVALIPEAAAPWPDDFLLSLMRHARKGRLTLVSRDGVTEQSHAAELRYLLIAALEREDFEADGNSLSSPVCYAELPVYRMPGRMLNHGLDKGRGDTDQK